MSVLGKIQSTVCIVPKLCVALIVLFLVAQLAIITALGLSLKGPDVVDPVHCAIEDATGKTRRPPRTLLPKCRGCEIASPGVNKSSGAKNAVENPSPSKICSNTLKADFPLLKNPTSWPPVENRLYPDMKLYNQDGKLTRLSDLAGNVIIVQPVAMSCPVSQAYSGANQNGKKAFKLCFPSSGVKDFGKRMEEFTGISMKTPGLIFVQLLLYNMSNEQPTLEDARQWARHFDLRTSENQYVLVAAPEMLTKKSKMLIPGFQLIDRSFTLRSDSTGILPKRSLYNHFFPTLESVLPRMVSDSSTFDQ